MKSPEILLDLNLKDKNIKLGRIVKKEFDEITDVHAKGIEVPAPTPKTDKGYEKLEPAPAPKAEPKGVEKLEPMPKFEPVPKAEPKVDGPTK